MVGRRFGRENSLASLCVKETNFLESTFDNVGSAIVGHFAQIVGIHFLAIIDYFVSNDAHTHFRGI